MVVIGDEMGCNELYTRACQVLGPLLPAVVISASRFFTTPTQPSVWLGLKLLLPGGCAHRANGSEIRPRLVRPRAVVVRNVATAVTNIGIAWESGSVDPPGSGGE
jgi:hypothetical protein